MAGGGDGTPQSKNWKFKNSTCGGQKPLEFLIFGRWDMWVCRICGWDTWVTKRMGQDVSLPDLADVTSGFRDLGQPWAPELYDSAVWWQSSITPVSAHPLAFAPGIPPPENRHFRVAEEATRVRARLLGPPPSR